MAQPVNLHFSSSSVELDDALLSSSGPTPGFTLSGTETSGILRIFGPAADSMIVSKPQGREENDVRS